MISRHLSTLTLHRLRYGELQGTELTHANEHLTACDQCTSRISRQHQERAAFIVQPMPDAIRKLVPVRAPWWRELLPLVGALAAASALFLAVPSLRAEPAEAKVREASFRGELPLIEAWVDRGQGGRPLHDDELLAAGDRVQLAYDPRGARSLAIAGRDDSGDIEVYTTDAPTGDGLVKAPFSLTLDDAPLQELFVVGSARALDETHVKAAIYTGIPGVKVARIVIPKQEARR